MALIYWGEVDAASDVTMATVAGNSSSQFRTVLAAIVALIIADEDTVIAAAAAAVDAALAEADVLTGDDERAMKFGDPYRTRVLDGAGKVAHEITADGKTYAPDLVSRRAALAGLTIVESPDGSLSIVDGARKVAFRVDTEGRTLIGDLHPSSNLGPASFTSAVIRRVVVLWEMGQSNAAARGLPVGPRLDPPHPRILMAQWSGITVLGVSVATVPVSSQQMLSTSGLDPATVIARHIVAEQDDTAVVICNASKGGSALVLDTANGVWGVGYAGVNTAQFPIATAALTKTLTEVAALYPGVPVDVQIVWHQGESDGNESYAAYLAALTSLVNASRTHIGDPTAPFVMGGTVPEDSNPTEELNIMGAQIAAQGTLQHTAFAAGVANGGGSSAPSGDTVHYNRPAMERLGARMREALRRAYVNQAESVPLTPLLVEARWRKSVGILDIQWEFPMCRVTAFTVQYSVDGGAWQTITGRPRPLDPVATRTGLTTGSEIRVRVCTINESGTSAYTTPITAIGA